MKDKCIFLNFFKKIIISFTLPFYFLLIFRRKNKNIKETIKDIDNRNLEIIILQFNRLGDALLTTPVLRELKKSFLKNKITVVVKDKGAYEVLKNNPFIDNLIFIKSFLDILKFIFKKRENSFSVLFDFSFVSFYYSLFFSIFLKSKIKIGVENHQKIGFFKLKNFNFLFDKTIKYKESFPYIADYFLSFLKVFNISEHNNKLDFFPESCDYNKFKIPNYKYILIHPGTRNLENSYLEWEDLIKIILKKYGNEYKIIILGNKIEFNLIKFPLDDLILNYKNIYHIKNTSLSEVAKLIDNSSLFLGLDSGVSHLAISRRAKSVVIFGRADFRMYIPDNVNFVEKVFSRDKGYPFFTFHDFFSCSKSLGGCTRKIYKEDILSKMSKYLGNNFNKENKYF